MLKGWPTRLWCWVVLDQNLDTITVAGKAFFHMLGVFAEFETNIWKERQAVGIARAKAERNTRAASQPSCPRT